MEILSLRTFGFRNLHGVEDLGFAPRFNLITGNNGQGKTNLIEAVSVLTSLRSFRTANHRRIVTHGCSSYTLEGQFRAGAQSLKLRQEVTVGPPVQRTLEIDGRSVAVDRYLEAAPIVALVPADRSLVSGEPSVRRAFLDRFAFLLEPGMYEDVRTYRRALRQRNAGLATHSDDRTLAAFEVMLARAAAAVIERRQRVVARLSSVFEQLHWELAGEGSPPVLIVYRGETWLAAATSRDEVEKAYLRRYNDHRTRDRVTGFTLEGPHRHDLGLRAYGRPVRDVLSSGQSKVLVAALRLAMLLEAERARGERLPILVDDIDAELDRTVLERLLRVLGIERQVLLSSANGERVMAALPGGLKLNLVAGSCREVVTFGE